MKETRVGQLQVRIYDNRSQLGSDAAHHVAERISRLLQEQETVNIILAAAPSQNEFLEGLSAEKHIAWNRINAFHMDEYQGLSADAPQGFGNFIKERIVDKVPFNSVYYINGNAEDAVKECGRYAGLLKQYPADIVCMGIGENNHIAFNDPHVAHFDDPERVKIVDLDQACRQQQVNDGCFSRIDEVPEHAFTLTVPALMQARYLFCMVPGKNKARAVYNTFHQDISEEYPSTILKTHPAAILFIDKDSAELV